MRPLSIIAYFDGRLGHEKQTLGILQALADITSTEVIQKRVSVSPASARPGDCGVSGIFSWTPGARDH